MSSSYCCKQSCKQSSGALENNSGQCDQGRESGNCARVVTHLIVSQSEDVVWESARHGCEKSNAEDVCIAFDYVCYAMLAACCQNLALALVVDRMGVGDATLNGRLVDMVPDVLKFAFHQVFHGPQSDWP